MLEASSGSRTGIEKNLKVMNKILLKYFQFVVRGEAAISSHPWKRQSKKNTVSALRNHSHLIHITVTIGS